jgi:hypothetical protein
LVLGFYFFLLFFSTLSNIYIGDTTAANRKRRREKNEGGRKLSEFVDHDLSCESANNPRRLVVLFFSPFPFFSTFFVSFLGGETKKKKINR